VNSESGEAHKENESSNGTDKVSPIPSEPTTVADIPTRNTEDKTANQTDWQRWHYWMQFAVFLVGGVVAFIYGCQLNEMRKATRVATHGLGLTREMARLDQRAWVATDGADGALSAGQPFVIHIKFKNTGKTFARHAQITVKTEITKKDTLPNFNTLFDPPKNGKKPVTMILVPNAQYEMTTDPVEGSPFSQEQIDNIRDNQGLFVFGRIDYADIFDRKHWTTFCYSYDVTKTEYSYCEKHNDADNRSGD
jgi:hypothetical protein